MKTSNGYNTKQRNEILEFLKNNPDKDLSVDDIALALAASKIKVGKTTVYRYMDKLTSEGKVRKYSVAGSKSAYYEYIRDEHGCLTHYHFKCTDCGHLLHVDCSMMDNVFSHMKSHHGFVADSAQTVIYGLCSACSKK